MFLESNPVLQNSASIEREAGDGAPNISNGPEEGSPKLFNSTIQLNTSNASNKEPLPEKHEEPEGAAANVIQTKAEIANTAPPLTLDSDTETHD